MMMKYRPNWEMLARYVTGECSEAEEAELLVWSARHRSRQALLRVARQAWEVSASSVDPTHIEDRLARVKSRSVTRAAPAVAPPRRSSRRSLMAAATIAGLALAGGAYLTRGAADPEPVAVRELVTDNGQRAHIGLSDGTQVFLAPDSRMEMLSGFGVSAREVRLSGQAYFEVARDESRPFLVHVRGTVTRVLGTEFSVRAYPGDSAVTVVVAEGTVSLTSTSGEADEVAILRAGELGELSPGAAEARTRPVDLDVHLAWRQGRLTFENTPLDEVARQIERWYGVTVRIGDASLESLRLTGSFRDQPVEVILGVVASSLELEWTRVGQTYVLMPRKARLANL